MPPSPHSMSQPAQEEFPSDPEQGVSIPVSEEGVEQGESFERELDPHEFPVPEETDDTLPCFGDDVEIPQYQPGVWEKEICECQEDLLPGHEHEHAHVLFAEQALLATTARKQKVEVQYKTLSPKDQELFDGAKKKEIKAWIDHKTVQRVSKGTLKPEQIMRCRWILRWKAPEVGSVERRAKARLVVLGFEDPDLSSVPRDAPTLTKDGRQLRALLNFDISTAFLKGKGD